MNCTIKSILLFILLSNFIIPITAHAYCAPYVAVINSIEPNFDCLQIRATGGCGGELEIVNNCPQIFYLEGEKIGNDSYQNSNYHYFHQGIQWYGDLINDEKVNQHNWQLVGKLGDQRVVINGKTIYNDGLSILPGAKGILWISVLIYFISILIIIVLAIALRRRRVNKLIIILLSLLMIIFLPFFLISVVSKILPLSTQDVISDSINSQININTNNFLTIIDKAQKKQEVSECQQISDNYYQQACVAIASSSIEKCNSIPENDFANWCIKKIATINSNMSDCSNIPDTDTRNFCILQIAINQNKPSICENISSISRFDAVGNIINANRDSCYSTIAINNNDKTICECIARDRDYVDCNLIIDKECRNCKEYNRLDKVPDICTEKLHYDFVKMGSYEERCLATGGSWHAMEWTEEHDDTCSEAKSIAECQNINKSDSYSGNRCFWNKTYGIFGYCSANKGYCTCPSGKGNSFDGCLE